MNNCICETGVMKLIKWLSQSNNMLMRLSDSLGYTGTIQQGKLLDLICILKHALSPGMSRMFKPCFTGTLFKVMRNWHQMLVVWNLINKMTDLITG